ncbi:hypothetical protein BDK51DRAFT_43686 [Blyttiomyces helicus]|uniref:Uncharacterized protein n=1 Tax=Blyttiomyces helicus TaxID=388810 RepID=A0A4P9VYU8_9FUNG|nr:hypothetical protein BDK51DRAFT_43686 [Blyttiomyces helicus]|eukprot:RKO84145.1 hypothetical protein BDK51DRAFT_43686 [Blyttiomyces helicus]
MSVQPNGSQIGPSTNPTSPTTSTTIATSTTTDPATGAITETTTVILAWSLTTAIHHYYGHHDHYRHYSPHHPRGLVHRHLHPRHRLHCNHLHPAHHVRIRVRTARRRQARRRGLVGRDDRSRFWRAYAHKQMIENSPAPFRKRPIMNSTSTTPRVTHPAVLSAAATSIPPTASSSAPSPLSSLASDTTHHPRDVHPSTSFDPTPTLLPDDQANKASPTTATTYGTKRPFTTL